MNEQQEQTELSEDMELVSPGQMLSEARIKLGLSCQQVSDKLNFRVVLVTNIENDIFDKSLPATFNRGYLRNYAKLVKISDDEVVSSYEALNIAELQGAELQSFSKETEKQAENNRLMWISYLILALVVGSTIMWWMQNKHLVSNKTQASEPVNQSTTLKNESKEIVNQKKESLNSGEAPTDAEQQKKISDGDKLAALIPEILPTDKSKETQQKINTGLVKTSQSGVVTEANNTLVEGAAIEEQVISVNDNLTPTDVSTERKLTPSELEDAPAPEYNEVIDIIHSKVSFAFSGDCWVNIYDNSGERIAWGIKSAGYEMNISGQAPFTVTLGKPELVTIIFDGQNVDMGQFKAGNIAKFTLPVVP